MMIKCSCLCGEIEFEARPVPNMVFNCHCSRCRKSHGAAFATQVIAVKDSLRVLKGRGRLTEYKSPKAIRAFCSQCGSRLMNYDNGEGSYLSVCASAIDGPVRLRPVGECFVKEKFDFVALDESIEHYSELPKFSL